MCCETKVLDEDFVQNIPDDDLVSRVQYDFAKALIVYDTWKDFFLPLLVRKRFRGEWLTDSTLMLSLSQIFRYFCAVEN